MTSHDVNKNDADFETMQTMGMYWSTGRGSTNLPTVKTVDWTATPIALHYLATGGMVCIILAMEAISLGNGTGPGADQPDGAETLRRDAERSRAPGAGDVRGCGDP